MADTPSAVPLRDKLYDALRRAIAKGDYPEGHRLPTENDLAKQFNVSRPIIREALARLRYEGVIASRRGSGSVVLKQPAPRPPRTGQAKSIADLRRCYEFREILEGEIAALAANRASEAEIRAIEAANATFVEIRRQDKNAIEEDLLFHAAIAKATRNPLFVSAILDIESLVRFTMSFGSMLETIDPHERLRQTLAEHHAIVEAIRSGDATEAKAAMATHIGNAHRRMFEDET